MPQIHAQSSFEIRGESETILKPIAKTILRESFQIRVEAL